MSTARTLKQERGQALYALQKGPNGRNLCRWCGKEVGGRRTTFCSDACVIEWRIRASPSFARQQVRKRDKGVCRECGRDTAALRKRLQGKLQRLNAEFRDHPGEALRLPPWLGHEMRWLDLLRKLKLVQYVPRYMSRWNYGWQIRSLWQADHIVEVVKGGGTCGLGNYQTLCICCHKRKTKRLAQERAAARRQSINQPPSAEAPTPCPS